ncbi:hypothetical protein MTX36_06055 [Rhodococcus sp. ARC_M6]|nr:hypothetical protein [Rhodococcus sp. ARC_M6]
MTDLLVRMGEAVAKIAPQTRWRWNRERSQGGMQYAAFGSNGFVGGYAEQALGCADSGGVVRSRWRRYGSLRRRRGLIGWWCGWIYRGVMMCSLSAMTVGSSG